MRKIKRFLIIICLLSIYTAFLYGCERKEDTENSGEQSQETLADMVKIDEYEENHRTILWENRTYYVDKKVEEKVISDYAGIIVSEESDQENVTVYTLENISQNLAVVIQNPKGEYYIYVNSEYCADTLGQFLNGHSGYSYSFLSTDLHISRKCRLTGVPAVK